MGAEPRHQKHGKHRVGPTEISEITRPYIDLNFKPTRSVCRHTVLQRWVA
jgi:hypothetical protein